MQNDVEAIVAELSIHLFELPPDQVEEAVTASRSGVSSSLVDEIASRGGLGDRDRGFLESLYLQLCRHEAQTLTSHQAAAKGTPAANAASVSEARQLPVSPGDLRLSGGARYQIREEHAVGGMGRILAVWDQRMHREVALKEVRPAGARNNDSAGQVRVLARFLQEARITGRLQHPSIIPVYEIGEREDGTLYYTMKFVRGRTLQQAIRDATALEDRLALLPHFLDLCQAMAYAHAHGVIHRDLKPSNVMIGEFGETLVIDWGLAKEIGRQATEPGCPSTAAAAFEAEETPFDLTMDGQLLGTPHYMPPEQAAGRHDSLDERADVYALGAVLYEILTGSRPYRASTGLEVLKKAASEPPQPPEILCPKTPPALAAICRRAMARTPEERYVSAAKVADEITRYLAGARVEAYAYDIRELCLRFIRRHRPVVITAALAAVLLAGVAGYSYLSLRARHATEHALRLKSEQDGYDLSIALAQESVRAHQYERARDILDRCPEDYRNWEWGRLCHVTGAVQQTLAGHRNRVEDMAIDPEGRYAVSVEDGSTAILRELPSGQLLHSYETPDANLCAVALHPAGREFLTCARSGPLRRWDTESGEAWKGAALVERIVSSAVYTPDGKFVLGAGRDGTVYQWDLTTGAIVREFPAPGAEIHCIAVSPDGQWFAAGDSAGMIYVWDWATGACRGPIAAHTDHRQIGVQGTLSVTFSHDSRFLASTGCDATAKVWDVDSLALQHTLAGHIKKVWCAEFSPDDGTLVTVAEEDAHFWDVKTGAELPSWIRCPEKLTEARYVPNANLLVTTGSAPELRLWDLAASPDADYLSGHQDEVNVVRFSPDGRYLASGGGHWLQGGDGRVLLWDLGADGQAVPAKPWKVLEGGQSWINSVAFHPGGNWLSAGDARGHVLTWNWHTGERIRDVAIPEYTKGLRYIVYNPAGTRFLTTGWADEEMPVVIEWDAETGQRLRELTGQSRTIDDIQYSRDGRYIAAGSRDGTAMVWNASTGEPVGTFPHDGWVYGVDIAPDRHVLAASNGRLSVKLWDFETGTLLEQLDGLNDRANKVRFSPDGQRVAGCDLTCTKVWSVASGASLLTLPHPANDVAFSPDGRTLATAGVDRRVGLWHSEPWREPVKSEN